MRLLQKRPWTEGKNSNHVWLFLTEWYVSVDSSYSHEKRKENNNTNKNIAVFANAESLKATLQFGWVDQINLLEQYFINLISN